MEEIKIISKIIIILLAIFIYTRCFAKTIKAVKTIAKLRETGVENSKDLLLKKRYQMFVFMNVFIFLCLAMFWVYWSFS